MKTHTFQKPGAVCMAASGALAALLLLLAGSAVADSLELEWTGLAGADWFTAGNWRPSRVPQAGDSVVIDTADTIQLTNATPRLAAVDLLAGTLVVSGWTSALRADTLNIAGRITHAENLTEVPNAAGEWGPQHRVLIEGSNVAVAASGIVDADYTGYRRGRGPGAPAGMASGAGHAGEGGFGNARLGGSPYGDLHAPWQPGSGGGTNATYRTQSGEGGGAIRVVASGCLTIDGTIRANGRNYYGTHGSGGSGGSVWLSCCTLAGSDTGRIQVNGGSGNHYGGGGSGGRIALHYDSAAQATLAEPRPALRFEGIPGAISANNSEAFLPGMGTLSLSDTLLIDGYFTSKRLLDVQVAVPGWTQWTLNAGSVNDCRIGLQEGITLRVVGDLILTNGALLHLFASPVANLQTQAGMVAEIGGDLRVYANSRLMPYAHPTNGATVRIGVAGDLHVAAGGGIDADRRGYTRGYGPGTAWSTRTDGGNGAGYGGHGGMGFGGLRWGDAYGDASWPVEAGSGGAVLPPSAWNAGRGGGSIRLDVTGQAEIHGTLTAKGGHGWSPTHGGGGSGGGILLTCRTLQGSNSGLLSVEGGQGAGGGSCGGGGRIAIHYDPVAQAALSNPVPPIRFSAYAHPWSTTGYYSTINAQEGTLWLPDALFLTEVISQRRFWHVRLVIPGGITGTFPSLKIDNCVLAWPDGNPLTVEHDLILTNEAAIILAAAATNDLSRRYGLELNIGRDLRIETNCWIFAQPHPTNAAIVGIRVGRNATLASGGGIDGNRRGYHAAPDNALGPGAGKAAYNSGGGYGGRGGGTSAGGTYGHAELPLFPGSPAGWNGYGGASGYSVGGLGGGAVHLRAGGEVRVDGRVTVDGGFGSYYRGSGGSGGSILLAAPQVTGRGTLSARGGIGAGDFASGGGGRIAVWQDMGLPEIETRLAWASTRGLTPVASPSFAGAADAGWQGLSLNGTAGTGSVAFCSGRLFFEAERFTPSSDGWQTTTSARASSTLSLHGASGDKLGTAGQAILIATGGRYRVWVRYLYLASTRGPFRLSVMNGETEAAFKVFDLATHPAGVDWDYVWDFFDVELPPGPYDLVFSKHEQLNCSGYVRHADCVLLTTDFGLQPDHRDYGPQTYVRVTMGDIYTQGVYAHIFADHYRSPWYSHHYLARDGMSNGLTAPVASRLLAGERTAWCNITRMLYQDSGAILNITIRHTYYSRPERMEARFEFAHAPEDAAIVRTLEVAAQPNGLIVVMPPNLTTAENRTRLGRDRDFAERTGQLADSYDWPTIGRKPSRFPFFVQASIGGYGTAPDQAVTDRELRTLDYYGFANWSRTILGGGTWQTISNSFCRPDTNKINTAAASRAQELAAAGKSPSDVVYCMLMDEPTGQSLDFMAGDAAYPAAFRAWLAGQGLSPADLLVAGWDEVQPVVEAQREARPALYFHSQRFRTRALGDFMAVQRRALESACGGSFPVNVNFSDGATYYANFYSQGVDYFELLDDAGQNAIWGEDWANGSSSYQCGAYNVDLMRAAARTRGQVIGHYVIAHAGRLPLDIKLKAVGNVARGAKMLKSYAYGVYWGSHEGGPAWSSSAWQNKPDTWRAHAEVLREIGGAEEFLLPAMPAPAEVAILYASSSDIWEVGGSGNFAYGFDRMHTWMALAHAQIPVDFLSERQIEQGGLDGYRVCYLAGPNLTRAAAAQLAAWVQAGGTLMATAGAGARDEYNRPLATVDGLLPAIRGSLSTLQNFRASGRYLRTLSSKGRVTVGEAALDVLSVRQPLTPKPGTVTMGLYEDASAAWIRGSAGNGTVHCLGFLPALDYIRQAQLARDALVAEAASEPPVPIDGEDGDAGEPVAFVSPEDRYRLEHSANPWEYPAAVREALLMPVRSAGVVPPVVCSEPQVDAVYMTCPRGVVIPLANYTLHPLPQIQFSIRVDGPVSRVETIHQGRISVQQDNGRVTFAIPLESTDFILIHYDNGFQIRIAERNQLSCATACSATPTRNAPSTACSGATMPSSAPSRLKNWPKKSATTPARLPRNG